MATPTFTLPTSGSDPKVTTKEGLEENINQIIQYLDDMRISGDAALMAGLEFQGGWDASTGLFPATNLDGGSLVKGDFFWVSTEGTFGSVTYSVNEPLVAAVDSPSTTDASDWYHAPLDPALVPVVARLDDMPVTFDTVSSFFSATLAEIKTSANATTGTIYVVVKDGGHRYSVDLAQATSYDTTTTSGVEFSIVRVQGRFSVKALGAVDGAESGAAIQTALDLGGEIVFDGVFLSDQELTVEKINIHLYFPVFQSDRIKVGPNFPEGGQLLTIKSEDRRQGGDFTEQPYFTGNERFFSTTNLFLDGDGRKLRAHGLVLEERTDDMTMTNTAIHDFKGAGFAVGVIDKVSEQDQFRESLISGIHIKNCGHGYDGYDRGALELHINAASAPIGSMNNIGMKHVKVIYSRGKTISFKSLGPDTVKAGRAVFFDDLFIHGNRSLVGTDPNGDDWRLGAGLVDIGHATATDTQVFTVHIGNLNMVETEDNQAGITVYNGSQLHIGAGYLVSSEDRPAIKAVAAGNISVGTVMARATEVNNVNPLTHLFEIESMQDQAFFAVGNVMGETIPNTTPNFVGDISLVKDAGFVGEQLYYSGDDAAITEVGANIFGQWARATQYINKIRIIPQGNLTSDDTDFATLYLTRKTLGVTTNNIAVMSTMTIDSGDWVENIALDFPVTNQRRLENGQTLSLHIEKSGAGVVVPAFVLQVEMSTNLLVN